MIRPDYLLLGYKIVTVQTNDIARAAAILLKGNVSVRFLGNKIYATARKTRKIISLLDTRVKYSVSELKGLSGFIYRNRKRWGAFCAIFLTAVILLFSGNLVWDVRIEGCESGNEEQIIRELSECGLSVGTSWSRTDTAKIEVKMLETSDYVSWVNINRRGTVAYVSVVDKITHELPEKKDGYSNVVAACDAVIEEVTVEKGIAVVKAGDTVKKGDLLISGIIPSKSSPCNFLCIV